MKRVVAALTILTLVLIAHQDSSAQEWGNLKGKVVFEGTAPQMSALRVDKDTEVCGAKKLFDESVVVGEGNGLANVAVYMYLKRGADAPPIHESYAETASSEVTLDNIDCRFEPHVTLLRTSQTLVIGNKDPVGHNTKIDFVKNAAINPIVAADSELKQNFSEAESRPVPVSCNIHSWMKGYLLVKDHPYFAVTGEDGSFEIANVPAGKWTFQFWHEKGKYLDEVKVDGADAKWKKGRVEVEIKAGDNDMGTISVADSKFK